MFPRRGHKFRTTFLVLFAAACTTVTAQAATHAPSDTAAVRGWYLGAEGGVPFAVGTFSSFAGGRTYAGWQAGVFAGYAFSRTSEKLPDTSRQSDESLMRFVVNRSPPR